MSEPSIYAKAIELIYAEGWYHGGTNVGECLVTSTTKRQTPEGTSQTLAPLVAAVGCNGMGGLMRWNDAPERTLEDIVLLLKYADAGELETWRELYGPDAS